MMNKVFLGGTCGESTWRDRIISLIQVEYFNPVVKNWTHGCIAVENDEKENKCNVHLYVITKEMEGVYSIAEAVNSSRQFGKTIISHVVPEGFSSSQLKSLGATVDLIRKNGGIAFIDNEFDRTARVINYCFKEAL